MGAAGLTLPVPGRRFDRPPILVTGAPRSGTTFVGDVLAHARGVRLAYEPLNAQIGLVGVPRQFVHVREGDDAEARIAGLVDGLLRGRGRFRASTIPAQLTPARRLVRATVGSRTHLRYRWDASRGGARWLLKDPLAAFAAGWLHRRFDAPTVVVVRHPAPVIASYLRLGWSFGLSDLAEQPALVERYGLAEIVGPGAGFSQVEGAARLWAAVYRVLGQDADGDRGILAVRHEDVSADPEPQFARLYAHVGLPFDARARAHVAAVTGAHNPAAPRTDRVHTLRRDSRADLGRWRGELSAADLATVRRLAGPTASRWYGDDEW